MNNNFQRQVSVDILRGIGILSVIWYHLGIQNFLFQYIASFHMILFFCASGYCYRKQSLRDNPLKFVRKKVKNFLRPYCIWAGVGTFLNFLLDCLMGIPKNPKSYLFNIIYSNLRFGASWFLMAIFIVTIIGGFLIDFIHNDILLICIGLSFGALGYGGSVVGVPSIFRYLQAFVCVPAFILSYLYRRERSNAFLSIGKILIFGVGG